MQQKANNSVVGTIVLHISFCLACQETNSFCFPYRQKIVSQTELW